MELSQSTQESLKLFGPSNTRTQLKAQIDYHKSAISRIETHTMSTRFSSFEELESFYKTADKNEQYWNESADLFNVLFSKTNEESIDRHKRCMEEAQGELNIIKKFK